MIPRSDLSLRTEIHRNVAAALAEDLGNGDLTAMLIPDNSDAKGSVISRESGILAGRDWFDATFTTLDPLLSQVVWHVNDGEPIKAGQTLCEIEAPARILLTAERTALNFLQTLSGVATQTAQFVAAIKDSDAVIVDTRKTLPGLRQAQKYAVRCGGGCNHRIGLYDGILIKENHIIAAGSIAAALQAARGLQLPPSCFIEIEVETLSQLDEALAAGATMILLDNMTLETMTEAVRRTAGRAKLEASGGVDIVRVRDIALTGVDRISIGGLTKNLHALDLSLRHIEL